MGNINNSLSHCEFDLFNNYELDWISEKTWIIKTDLKNNSYSIQKGKINIETKNLFNILLSKKINNLINIKTLKINFNLEYNLCENFYFNIFINNENNIQSKIYVDKILLNNKSISFSKKNKIYEENKINSNKFTLSYKLDFNNSGIIISNRSIEDNKNIKKIIFSLNYNDPIYINFEIYNKNTSDKISYFKLNL